MEFLNNLFVNIAAWFRSLFMAWGAGPAVETILMALVYAVAIIIFALINVILLVYMERKVAGYMQQRLGPNRWGPGGIFQSVWDAVKLIGKEDIIPANADKNVFLLAAVVVFVPATLVFMVIPFGAGMTAVNLNASLFWFLAISSIGVLANLMAGWGSNNKYSLLGGMRSVAQTVSYEIPLVFSLLGIVMLSGTLNLGEIVAAQKDMWYVVLQPVAFIVYLIAATAELNRGPFDMPEGEQEIVAGPFTEYTGIRYTLFFLSEYMHLLAVSALAASVFLGGWTGPWLPSWLWFIIKTYIVIFVFMWFKWTFPRIRIDHLMHFNWKFLLPISLVNILLTGVAIKIFGIFGG